MNKKYILILLVTTLAFFSNSCNSYLDTTPDNRTELDSKEKLTKLLTSGYANHLFALITETMSDNVDDRGGTFNTIGRLQDQAYAWEDINEVGNESPKRVWETYYGAIAVANQVLDAIDQMGNPEDLQAQKGEALMIRAYHHFMLVNIFCKHYSTQNGNTDLGIPYMEKPETTVSPKYERGNVAEVYEKIDRDIEAGLSLIDDNLYTVPKYHFNQKAAYAFAARFNLYYRKYDKVIEYADRVLGINPKSVLRDVKAVAALTQEYGPIAENYIKISQNANLLLMTGYSSLGYVFGNYGTGKKYMHSEYLAKSETTQSDGPWGEYRAGMFYLPPLSYNTGYVATPKLPALFEMTDPVAQTGFRRTVYPAFQTDEILLCRAEAYIMLQNYTNATADLALWMSQHTTSASVLTRDLINSYYSQLEYYTYDEPTVKKRLNPEVPVASAEQENFLQCLLHMRRIETISEGMRWFDIKRFGIVIYRRFLDDNYRVTKQDELSVDDQRRAVQLPLDVINAGLTPNPR